MSDIPENESEDKSEDKPENSQESKSEDKSKNMTEKPEDQSEAKADKPQDDDQGPKKRWYVIHAYSGFEGYVQRTLLERITLKELDDKFGDVIVPTEEIVEMRSGQKRKSERKFFPGYVLVQMVMDDETWHFVKSIPRVLGFIGGTAEKPAPISAKEADAIINRVEEGEAKPTHKILFEPGEVIRVTDGPFADFNGVVEDVNYEKSRLRVSVSIFGRATPVELEFGQVEKA